MSTHVSPARAAAPRPTSGPAACGRRLPNKLTPADQLEQLSARLDVLIRDTRLGARSHREHERIVDEAEAIGAGIGAVFRQVTPPQPTNPPLARSGNSAWY